MNYNYDERYTFTEQWFDINIPMWTELFKFIKDNTNFSPITSVLEVGCFEGRATVWLCENVLTDQNVKYTYDVVDTFAGSAIERGMSAAVDRLQENDYIWNNFKKNTSFFTNVTFNVHRSESQKYLSTLSSDKEYDLVYIDASHKSDDTFVDAYFAQKALKKGGILIFDDFLWKDPSNSHINNSPEMGIRLFCELYHDEYDVVHNGYQVVLVKK